jgi:multidrug resistance efflux pump
VKKLVWFIIFLLVGGASALIYFGMRPSDAQEQHVVTRGSIRQQTRGLGRVEGTAEMTLVFGRPGNVASIKVSEGMDVEEGALLAELNSAELDTRVEIKVAQLKQAEAKLARAKNPLSMEMIKQAEDKWTVAKKEVEGCELRLKNLKNPITPPPGTQSQIEEADRQLSGAKHKLTLANVELQKLKGGATETEKAQAENDVELATAKLTGVENELKAHKVNDEKKTRLETDVAVLKKELEKVRLQRDKVRQPASALDISAAQARVTQAQLEVDSAEAAKAELISPRQPKPASQSVIDEVMQELGKAQNEEMKARHQFDMLKRGPDATELAVAEAAKEEVEKDLDLLKLHREGLKLIAPFSGRVVKRHVEPGSTINGFVPVLTIVNLKHKRVRCEFDVASMKELSKRIDAQKDSNQESTVELTSKAFKEPMKGKVDKINGVGNRKLTNEDPSAPKGGQVLEVLVNIDDPQSALQKEMYDLMFPGLHVDVAVTLEKRDNVLIIPKSYVMTENGEEFVLVKSNPAPGSLETARRKIKCGLRDEQNVEILSNLTESDQIVKPKPANGK